MGRKRAIPLIFIVLLIHATGVAQTIERVATFDALGWCEDLAISGNYAYLACDTIGLVILNIENPSAPFEIGRYSIAGFASAIERYGNYVCILIEDGIMLFDVSNPVFPVLTGSYTGIGWTGGLAIGGDHAFVISDQLYVIEISDPANPRLLGSSSWGPINSILIIGNYAYLARGGCNDYIGCYGRLVILDITNPVDPTQVGLYQTGWNPVNDVSVFGDYAFLATGGRFIMNDFGDLRVVDISDPANPQMVSGSGFGYQYLFPFYHVFARDRVAFLGRGINKVVTYNDTLQPEGCINIDSAGVIINIYVDNDWYVYTTGNPSFQIFRFTPTSATGEGNRPGIFLLSQNYPNPFNAATSFAYSLPSESEVTLEVFDIAGRRVESRALGRRPAGNHSFVWEAAGLSSGIYLYRLRAGADTKTGRCILLK